MKCQHSTTSSTARSSDGSSWPSRSVAGWYLVAFVLSGISCIAVVCSAGLRAWSSLRKQLQQQNETRRPSLRVRRRQLWCGIWHGHLYQLQIQQQPHRLSLRCVLCDHESPGVDLRIPVPSRTIADRV